MSVSAALERSAKDFCLKYSCDFDFDTFGSRVEEFTFLRPVGGWIDVYKATFDGLYKKTMEKVVVGMRDDDFDAEAMLDDFEYTLIRPYVKERGDVIQHRPYVGMDDRVARLEYLDRLTKNAPSNPVALFTEKYKKGTLSIGEMLRQVTSAEKSNEKADLVEIAGYVQALENANNSRSVVWRIVHPIKNSAELREAQRMKKILSDRVAGSEEAYRDIADEARKPVEGYERLNAGLGQSIAMAREDITMKEKMNNAVRESLRIEGFDSNTVLERAPRVTQLNTPTLGKQNKK